MMRFGKKRVKERMQRNWIEVGKEDRKTEVEKERGKQTQDRGVERSQRVGGERWRYGEMERDRKVEN